MSKRDLETIGAWCRDAHAELAGDLPPEVAALRAETINRFTGRAPIVEVARDLAEGLSHLPRARGDQANAKLKSKYGFGFEYFISASQKQLVKVLGRGSIRTEAEHQMALDALSDLTLEPGLRAELQSLVLERARQLRAT